MDRLRAQRFESEPKRLRSFHDLFPVQGFTLLEILVAMAVFSVMSILAYGGIRAMTDSNDRVTRRSEQLTALQGALALMGRDLQQAVAREVRGDPESVLPAMSAVDDLGAGVEFTCNGRSNPADKNRSSLQRVAYRLVEDNLVRLSWPVLDRAGESEAFEQVLLREVGGFELSFLSGISESGEPVWLATWPEEPTALPEAGRLPGRLLPYAVKVSVTTKELGQVARIFLVAGADV